MIEASVRGQTPPIPATYVREFLDEYIHVPDNGSYSAEFERFLTAYIGLAKPDKVLKANA